MQNPSHDIIEVVALLAGAVTPDIQKAAFDKFVLRNAGFRHPLVSVAPGRGSRDTILGIYQWYRVMSPELEIRVNHVVYDRETNVLICDISQKFHIRFNPLPPAWSQLLVRLTLTEADDGLHYIAFQEDFYHPDDFTNLILPILSPFVRVGLAVTAQVSTVSARVAQVLGVWRTDAPVSVKHD
ncbi:hypothetical protein PLICRDRAFT_179153 [Plicaturopsis crispa FD-325 SS-3]|uniref:SigF-like NTF2-like domain-containing protein n=1 Tax=Plicaturopsis crispa FD-325 SS-3 TaxID=944288 RepID=A0A0C9SRM5_PLICR|nr:hypothetical protein PLICRDRAFT_179153 [Plicaturopsis crispa FD-325 SS-3]